MVIFFLCLSFLLFLYPRGIVWVVFVWVEVGVVVVVLEICLSFLHFYLGWVLVSPQQEQQVPRLGHLLYLLVLAFAYLCKRLVHTVNVSLAVPV